MTNRVYTVISLLFSAAFAISCSRVIAAPTSPPIENEPLPTPASTLPEIISNMSSDNMAVRLVSIYELEKYGDKAILAIPALISNLYVDDFDVRVAAIIALGHLGPNAKPAIPDLVYVLRNDSYIHAKSAAADALGLIGDRAVIPELATALFAEDRYQAYNVATSCAVSIARITGQKFTDFDSTTGYSINKDGVPLIVMDAQKWWLEEGQYQDWSN